MTVAITKTLSEKIDCEYCGMPYLPGEVIAVIFNSHLIGFNNGFTICLTCWYDVHNIKIKEKNTMAIFDTKPKPFKDVADELQNSGFGFSWDYLHNQLIDQTVELHSYEWVDGLYNKSLLFTGIVAGEEATILVGATRLIKQLSGVLDSLPISVTFTKDDRGFYNCE